MAEIFDSALLAGYEKYPQNLGPHPHIPSPVGTKLPSVSERQCVKNSLVDLITLTDIDVLTQRDGWTIKKMFEPSFLSSETEWNYAPDYMFRAKIVDTNMARRKLRDGQQCYYLNIIYMVNIPEIGIRLVKQDNISANFTAGSNLTRYLFNMGFDVYNIDEFNPRDLISLDALVNIGRNEYNYLVVNYAEKFSN